MSAEESFSKESSEQSKELKVINGLLELTSRLSSNASYSDKMNYLCGTVAGLINCDRSSIFILEQGYYRAKYNYGNPPDIAELFVHHKVSLKDPLIKAIMESGLFVIINEAANSDLMNKQTAEIARIKAIVVVPIFDKNHKPFGFITAEYNEKPGVFTEMDAAIILGIAKIAEIISRVEKADFELKKSLAIQKDIEIRLQQAQKIEAIGALAGGIAHDFNNILSSIMGFSELAADYAPKESKQHGFIIETLNAANRAKDLVKQILTFARKSDLELQLVQPKHFIKESLKLLRASIPSTIFIKQYIQSDSYIAANPTHIHQVAMNLCTNASHSMEESGGTINVELRDVVLDEHFAKFHGNALPGKYILLSVSDEGTGINPDIIEKIFDPYFTTKNKNEGTGLGLSVVKGIVDELKGIIDVKSEPGKGSVFNVYFPVLDKIGQRKNPENEDTPIYGGNERILFVDDEPTLAEISEQMLTSLGYQVLVKTNPEEALEIFREKPESFDLIISDMTMPKITGNMLAAEAIKIRPGIPFILCTGYSKRISDERAKEIGVKAFLLKPITKSQMAEAIRKVLNKTEEAEC